MRPRVRWMTGSDDSILEMLDKSGVALSPRGLEINIEREGGSISNRTVKRRIKKLEQKGLVELVNQKSSYYAITEKGRRYLKADLDASDLEDDDAEN